MTGKIKLVHSGGNAVSIAVPSSNPSASEVEFKLPGSDGSANQVLKTDGSGNLSFAADQGGKILQVVHGFSTTAFSTSSDTMADIGLSAAITPSSSSNKVLVFGNIGGIETSATNNYGSGRLLRDSTSIIADIDRGVGYTADSGRAGTNSSFFILDSPSTTSSITYKVQFRRHSGGTITTQTNDSRSAITLMEVAV